MKRILARIAISQIQPFSNFAGIRNRFLYQICHFSKSLHPFFTTLPFPISCTTLGVPIDDFRRISIAAKIDRETSKIPPGEKIQSTGNVQIQSVGIPLDCNPCEPMLISLTGIANLFNHFMRSEPANSCSCFTRINRERRIESPFLD